MSAGGAEREARELAELIKAGHISSFDDSIEAVLKFANEARLEALEQSLAIYQRAFEQNWVVQDTIDAIRALKEAK